MAGTGLMDRNTDATATPAPPVDTGAAVAAYKDANQGVLDNLVSSALKRGSIDDPKVRDAIVGAGDAYHKGMLAAINTPVPQANSNSSTGFEPVQNYSMPGSGSPVIASSSNGTQVLYTKPNVVGIGQAVGKDTFDAQGNYSGSIMPSGYDSNATAANARMVRAGSILDNSQVNGPEPPQTVTSIYPSSEPVYTRDRRGNITGVAREATPGYSTASTFDNSGLLMGTPSTSINESTMTPDELYKYRAGLASSVNAAAEMERNRIQDEFNKGMLNVHDKEIALKRIELNNERFKTDLMYGEGGVMGSKRERDAQARQDKFLGAVKNMPGFIDQYDGSINMTNPDVTYGRIETMAKRYGMPIEDAYMLLGLQPRDTYNMQASSITGRIGPMQMASERPVNLAPVSNKPSISKEMAIAEAKRRGILK